MKSFYFVLPLIFSSFLGVIPTYAIDTFDSGLDGWVYVGSSGYSLSNDNGIAHISGNGVSVNGAAEKTFGVSNADSVTLSFDWRASSGCTCSSATNFRLTILDTSGNTLSSQTLQAGGTTDTGIKSYSADITGIVSGHDSIVVRMWLNDSWSKNWDQKIWWDNADLQATQSQQTTVNIDTATDDLGNSASKTQTVTIPDPRKITQGDTPLNELNRWIVDHGGIYFGIGIFTFGFLIIGIMASPKTVPIFTIILVILSGLLHATGILVLPAWFWGIIIIMAITLVLKRKK